MNERELARLLGWARVGLGVALFVAPRAFTRLWLGDRYLDAPARMALRGMGARDLILGAGLLRALERNGDARSWVEAGAAVDAADCLNSIASWDDLPRWRQLVTLATAGGAAALGVRIAPALD
ncbi:MAG TPA: hypothetical protein VHJ82_09115 [Actinomycetota bacterium]|nr:hypothetical protein [Actinomycetota bacterium]